MSTRVIQMKFKLEVNSSADLDDLQNIWHAMTNAALGFAVVETSDCLENGISMVVDDSSSACAEPEEDDS